MDDSCQLIYELMFVADAAGESSETVPVRALTAAVDGLVAADPGSLTDVEVAELMVELRRQQARLAAAVVEATAVFDARQVYAGDGSRSAADWISARTRQPRREVRAEVRLGRRLRVMPLTRAALRAGDIGVAHAHKLAGLAANPRTAAHFPEGEPLLVANARSMRFDDFDRTADHWRDAADPDGPERRRGRDHDLRRVDLHTGLGGVGLLSGRLTDLANATVGGALERIEQELFAADWAAARGEHGDNATAAHLARTRTQRQHDALVEMALRAMTAPADGKRPAPLLTIMVGYETFAGRVCQLARGTVIAPGTVADLLGRDDTLIERVVFDGPNRVTDISSARTFRGTLRRVLQAKHPRCTHDTCHVPAHQCQGDHIVAWSHGGLTTQDNGQLQCGHHNRWRHQHPDTDPTARGAESAGEAPASHAGWYVETAGERLLSRHLGSRHERWRPRPDLTTDPGWRPITSP